MNKFDEMRSAVQEAEATMRAADSVALSMVRLLVGRLRKCGNNYLLGHLKRELRDFNMTTNTWKND